MVAHPPNMSLGSSPAAPTQKHQVASRLDSVRRSTLDSRLSRRRRGARGFILLDLVATCSYCVNITIEYSCTNTTLRRSALSVPLRLRIIAVDPFVSQKNVRLKPHVLVTFINAKLLST